MQAEIDRVWLPRFLGSKTIGIQARRIVATTRHGVTTCTTHSTTGQNTATRGMRRAVCKTLVVPCKTQHAAYNMRQPCNDATVAPQVRSLSLAPDKDETIKVSIPEARPCHACVL